MVTAALMAALALAGDAPQFQWMVFTAKWCAPCHAAEADYRLIKCKIGYTKDCGIWKIDADEYPKSLEDWKIERLPTFVLLSHGREIGRHVGYPGRDVLERGLRGAK